MKHILLLGAGFSQNWGGWVSKEVFEYLLEKKEIHSNPRLLNQLWLSQEQGFENFLGSLHNGYANFQDEQSLKDLQIVESIIRDMFKDMNNGFFQNYDWDHNNNLTRNLFTRFDAVFTLNQDLLLERHYLGSNVQLAAHGSKKWIGYQIPGMEKITPYADNPAEAVFTPTDKSKFTLENFCQPFIKLHGSSNWVSKDSNNLLIMGSNKEAQISKFEVLSWYFELFEEYLNNECKLMIIGYGFQDDHINKSLIEAAEKGLKLFNINPLGSDQALLMNKSKQLNQIRTDTNIETLFKKSLIGTSRKPLRETFKELNSAEFNKISRFFT